MGEEEKKNKTAVVCYCALADGVCSCKLERMLYRIQELFEQSGFKNIKQAFVTVSDLPIAIPFKEYRYGFRPKLKETDNCYCFAENLVLSYSLFQEYFKKSARKGNEEFYLILLKAGNYEREEELENIIDVFKELKQNRNIFVCCFSEESQQQWENGFVDGWGENALRLKI